MGYEKNKQINAREKKRARKSAEHISAAVLEELIHYYAPLLAAAACSNCRMGIGLDSSQRRLIFSGYYRGQSYVARLAGREHTYETIMEELDYSDELMDEICDLLAAQAVAQEREGGGLPAYAQTSE